MSKQQEGEKDKLKRQATRTTLASLVGKAVDKMSDKEKDALLIVIGQQLGLLDESEKVKPL